MRRTSQRPAGAPPADETIDPEDSLATESLDDALAASQPVAEDDIAATEASRESALERELTTERDRHLRLAAEFDNFRKRMIREKLEAESRGQAELVKQLLDPLDDVARFAHVDPAVTDSATLVQGVDMVDKKLAKTLRAAGLEPVNPLDGKFDPALHEAVGTDVAASPEQDGTVSVVYQVGYTFKGQLLRPARVVVRQYHGRS